MKSYLTRAKLRQLQNNIFKKMSLRARILTVSAAVTVLVCTLSAYFAVKGYQLEKQAHLFEAHTLRTNAAAERLKSFLVTLPATILDAKEADKTILSSPELLRPPQVGEVFVIKVGDKIKLAWQNASGTIMASDFNLQMFAKSLEDMNETPFAVVDPSGKILFASQISASLSKQLLSKARQSGLAQFQSTFSNNTNDYIFSFLEVPRTNVSFVTLQIRGDFLLPLRRALWLWAGICFVFLSLGLGVQFLLVSLLSEPLSELVGFFKSISLGRVPVAVQSTLVELTPVFDGANVMQKSIEDRENRLSYFANGLQRILQQGQQPSDFVDDKIILDEFLNVFFELLKKAAVYAPIVSLSQDSNDQIVSKIYEDYQDHFGFTSESKTQFCFVTIENHQKNDLIQNLFTEPLLVKDYYSEIQNSKKGFFCLKVFAFEKIWGNIIVPFNMNVPFAEYTEFSELLKLSIDTLQNTIVKKLTTELKIADDLIKKEISFAQNIHERCIDLKNEMSPQIQISSAFRPAGQVGGDWMGAYWHPKLNLVHFYLGDVSGHGLDSAFLVSLISGAIKMAAREFDQDALRLPDQIDPLASEFLTHMCGHLNALLTAATSSRFMTMAIGLLDADSGTVYLANLGHVPPLRFLQDGSFAGSLVTERTDPLGAWNTASEVVHIKKQKLVPGETLLLFTDGLYENRGNGQGQLRSKRDLKEIGSILARNQSNSADVASQILAWSMNAPEGWTMKDDVAILAIKFLG